MITYILLQFAYSSGKKVMGSHCGRDGMRDLYLKECRKTKKESEYVWSPALLYFIWFSIWECRLEKIKKQEFKI